MRKLLFFFLLSTSASLGQELQPLPLRTSVKTEYRAIRRDVPMTNSIRRAFEAGTRDFSGRPGPNYWQLETDFTIQVSLDPHTQTLTGTEKILVHNNSKDDLDRIVLRLDHNVFRGDVPRGSSIPAEQTEGMVVTRIRVAGEDIDLTETRMGRSQAPKPGVSGLKKTVATIYLGRPIKAGSTAELEIDWHTKLPGGTKGLGHRMTQRFDSTLFQPTQWFPRLAKYDDMRGWETSPYLGPAEFFNNFGKFDVSVTVPGGWIVSGTGLLQNPQEVLTPASRERLAKVLEADGETTIVSEKERGPGIATAAGEKLTWRFVADRVNDFAWAASADFIWKGTRANIPGKGYVPIYMVYEPERAESYENAATITRHALEFYSELWAPYPFPQLTLQDGPSAGMEYPMVINSNQGAADHETAHQWWPMMLGTNETRYGWMDEGFNQYMNILSAADARGVEARLDGLGQSYGRISGSEDEAPLMWSANEAGMGYSFQTYQKTPLMLSMLGGIVGDEAVIKAMRKYTAAWAFKHPSPWDYLFFMNQELGQNLEWFWYYWLFTTESVDGSIAEVDTSDGKTRVKVRQDGQMPSPVVLQLELEPGAGELKLMPNGKQTGENTVEVSWPVDIWWSGSRSFEAELDFGDRKVKKITLDPHGRFPDRDVNDNVWPRK
ncbi:M1 family metallopeptidase [Algoriphagus sp. H41]|uniref:M1 family metallopeptidase n=1 Tax=Algoriphagus oliviformis TaxID=2811231 RepID=A0ABS3C8R6_9BACT|nr:M1 family metallopeptidase [Algoriphagus oliviformis]MBN7813502.1 M1 family metallopeptidase [Algoriphagus oliviformis]